MARQVHLFDRPARFVAGTVGQPGDRTFFLQATGAGRTVSVSLEKVQVSLLADRLEELLGEVQRRLGAPVEETPAAEEDNEPLDMPVDEEFRVGAMGLAWDGEAELVVVEAQAAGDEPADESTILEDVEDGPDVLRVRVTSAALSARAGKRALAAEVDTPARRARPPARDTVAGTRTEPAGGED